MKKSSKTIRWIFTALFGLCAWGNGFHYSTLLLLSATVLLIPIDTIQGFVREKLNLKKGLALTLAILLFFIGILNSPLSDTPPNEIDNSSLTSSINDDVSNNTELTSSENSEKEEVSSVTSSGIVNSSQNSSREDTVSKEDITSSSRPESSSESTVTSTVSSEDVQSSVGSGSATPVDLSDVPKYSGKPYITVNENIPNFSAEELTQNGYEKYSPLDSLGRTRMAIASVGKDTMPGPDEERGSISNIKPSGWKQAKYSNISGGWLYNRCHLIGWQLSAENENKSNLITGTKYLNIKGMLPFENMVADYIKETNNHVAYRITPIYNGNNLLASGVQMEAYSVKDNGEGICFNVYCYNVQPDIKIDYTTGESTGPAEETVTSSSTPAVESKPEFEPESETEVSEESSSGVWIPNSGSKFHSYEGCSNMKNPRQVSREVAEAMGYDACKKCW